jgi:hypothetical protein
LYNPKRWNEPQDKEFIKNYLNSLWFDHGYRRSPLNCALAYKNRKAFEVLFDSPHVKRPGELLGDYYQKCRNDESVFNNNVFYVGGEAERASIDSAVLNNDFEAVKTATDLFYEIGGLSDIIYKKIRGACEKNHEHSTGCQATLWDWIVHHDADYQKRYKESLAIKILKRLKGSLNIYKTVKLIIANNNIFERVWSEVLLDHQKDLKNNTHSIIIDLINKKQHDALNNVLTFIFDDEQKNKVKELFPEDLFYDFYDFRGSIFFFMAENQDIPKKTWELFIKFYDSDGRFKEYINYKNESASWRREPAFALDIALRNNNKIAIEMLLSSKHINTSIIDQKELLKGYKKEMG